MNPILSPFWFYLIGVVTQLKSFFSTIGWILLIPPLVISAFYFLDERIEEVKKKVKQLRVFICLGLLALFLNYATPTQTTCYQMMAASMITPNNIEAVGNATESIVDYVIESANRLMEEKVDESNN